MYDKVSEIYDTIYKITTLTRQLTENMLEAIREVESQNIDYMIARSKIEKETK